MFVLNKILMLILQNVYTAQYKLNPKTLFDY